MSTTPRTSHPLTIALLGEAVLRQSAQAVSLPDAEIERLAETMMQVMSDRGGVGIAAPQLHHSLALMIVASRPNPRYPDAPQMAPLVMANPTITAQSPQRVRDWEGCLSVPGIRGLVARPQWVKVSFDTLDGYRHHTRLEGFAARIFCHELDHLQGLTFLDRVDNNRDLLATEVWLRERGR
ncbi:peptide deformylase [Ferrimonas sediminicola]|uniref:Peptide deformylase n=1 Tax=Ferrimonas sediminicola TaxID=2569538 RepID=A0A4U1BC68_9GAMM|nr:peptide deformylase [Ferrimonas sediminicola]TKB48052.1 peptide deformylase [Ferrimonas sediminicola]